MSTPLEFESPARQNFGPSTPTSDFEPLLVHKLADGMSVPSVDAPQAMPSEATEPDSTGPTVRAYPDAGDGSCDSENEQCPMESGRATDVPETAARTSYAVLKRDYTDGGRTTVPFFNHKKQRQSYKDVDGPTVKSAPCVSSSSQMLLLPTILSAGTTLDSKPLEGAGSPAAVSQIIIASDAYSDGQTNPRNVLPETNFTTRPKPAKVQILSNISLPKTTSVVTYSHQYTSEAPPYNASEHVYKLNAAISNVHTKRHGKSQKNAALNYPNLSSTVISPAHLKGCTFPKGSNTKSINKVNNGANANVGSVGTPTNQCHILSRVVSGPKLAVPRKGNTFKGARNSSQNAGPKNQSRSIKIIQQTSRPEIKSWAVENVNSKSTGYIEGNVKVTSQKASPTHKSLALLAQKSLKNEQRVVLQSPCGPVLISTAPISVSHHRPSHYVQSGSPTLRYVHSYVQQSTDCQPTTHPVSANQHLTAQILQSLSQPKLMLQSNAPLLLSPEPVLPPLKTVQHRRHISGDPSTLLMADDIVGMEERPNLSEEIIRYTHDALAFVMLDHTYALSSQKLSPVPSTNPTVATNPPITSPAPEACPPSPSERLSSPPVVTSTVPSDFQMVTTSTGGNPVPSSPIANIPALSGFTFKSLPAKSEDDDAASAVSSTDGRRRDRAGSDTETAPEVDDGKTRCICDFTHDDGYMICCDRCGEWQHVDCMGIDRNNIPDAYQCSDCQPRKVERRIARALQMRKREEFGYHGSGSESSDGTHAVGLRRKRLLTVTTYSDTSGVANPKITGNNLPVVQPQSAPQPKRIPVKRPKKADIVRKGAKRKLTEKRVKRKKELIVNRSKYVNVNSQSSWLESYELAVTNHYSPELRAKIMKYSSKGGNSPSMSQAISAHHCSTVPHAGGKILIATGDLKANTAIVELRGKYMLSTQHRPQIQVSNRTGAQKPGPFVFFYRLPKDNTQVCIDTRTYGNEARFVRRSCKYNAELQHCIVKGTLHVYISSLVTILDGIEITVPHDHSGTKQPCACGNPKHCKLNGFNTLAARKAPADIPREKRCRNRRSSSSSPGSPQESPIVPPVQRTQELPAVVPPVQRRLSVISANVKSVVRTEVTSPLKSWGTTFTDAIISESIFKEEKSEEVSPEPLKCDAVEITEVVKSEIKEEKENVVSEKAQEIKLEIIQADVETVEAPLSPVKEVKEDVKKEEPLPPIEIDRIPMPEGPPPKVKEEKEKVTRSVTARVVCHERSTRSTRTSITTTTITAAVNHDSTEEKTDNSQDKQSAKDKRKMTREERKMEAIMRAFERMEKAEQRRQEVRERQSKRRESDPAPPTDGADVDDGAHSAPAAKKRRQRKGRARTTSQNALRRRLNSADSDAVTSADDSHASPTRDDPTAQLSSQPPRTPVQDVGLSSACLLVEAAVGPLESAFKLPKTKKTMANEWVGRSPEHNVSYSSYRSPPMSARSLESLVRVASTMIGDLGGDALEPDGSPPRTPVRNASRPPKKAKRGAKPSVPEPAAVPIAQHSAKKRWLRQAISEESDSPTAESPPSEMVTPLKKRRLARESLSLEQTAINSKPEETSPHLTGEDSPVKEDCRDSITRHCKMKSRYMDAMYGADYTSDSQNVFLNLNNPRDEKFNLDIRRIIGVPGTEETYEDIPMPKTPEERKPIDVNDNEFQHVPLPDDKAKVTPMEIDIDISPERAGDTDKQSDQTETIIIHSNDTSGNSSPQRDEMDDIQKKIHSFHTENIQILKIRNKKLPKEKRKKVNLNFDLNMVDDRISIQLRSSPRPEMNGDIGEELVMIAADGIPLPPPVVSESLADCEPRYISWTEDIPLPAEPMKPKTPEPAIVPSAVSVPVAEEPVEQSDLSPVVSSPSPVLPMSSPVAPVTVSPPVSPEKAYVNRTVAPEEVVMSASFSSTVISEEPVSEIRSTGLFSGFFKTMMALDAEVIAPVENVSHVNIINSINKNIDESVFVEKPVVTPVDELRNVQEILDRVNSMDANTSMILSGVLNSDVASKTELLSPVKTFNVASKMDVLTPVKTFCSRSGDPRLNPQPADKLKPVRRKLSITEYLKRHKAGVNAEHASDAAVDTSGTDQDTVGRIGDWSSDSSSTAASRSPLRLDIAASVASDELETRLSQALKTPLLAPFASRGTAAGEFDAQPTQLERQRENLSQRLRREFGLTLPEDEEARSATALQGSESQAVEQHVVDLLSGDKFPRAVAAAKLPHDR